MLLRQLKIAANIQPSARADTQVRKSGRTHRSAPTGRIVTRRGGPACPPARLQTFISALFPGGHTGPGRTHRSRADTQVRPYNADALVKSLIVVRKFDFRWNRKKLEV
jgi:hypothetical protein